jgi:outer membrane protein insertion porin family
LTLLFLLLALFVAPLSAQDPVHEGRTVVAIEIEGNVRVSRDQIVGALRTRVGQPLAAKDLGEDLKNLFSRFGVRAAARAEERSGGVAVVLTIDEARFIDRVEAAGVAPKRGNELLDDVALLDARGVSEAQVRERARELEKRLRDEGHWFATVAVAIEEDARGVIARLTIDDGPLVEVEDIRFEGLGAVRESDLRDLMTTDTPTLGLFASNLRRDFLDRDLGEIEAHLRREGYRDATATLAGVDFDEAREQATVRIAIALGERYVVEEIGFEGVSSEREAELRAMLELKAGEPLRTAVIARDQRRIADDYGERGRPRARVEPRLTYADEGPRARLRYSIAEDEEKRVRAVRILGNAATLDEVIRRRVSLEPGDVASTSELLKTRDRLRRMRIFDDSQGRSLVDVRFEATDDPLLEDVFVDVEEARAGRLFLSAFASTDVGFFGGVQIELDNFDLTDTPSAWDPVTLFSEIFDERAFHGGGQQLDVVLLPGSGISTYRITFVEPYLFGPERQPRSLRLDLYWVSSRLEDEFEERRLGTRVTLAKEWSDELTAGVRGRLETVRISDVDGAPDDVDDVEGSNLVPSLGAFVRYQEYDSFREPTDGFEVGAEYELLFADAAGQKLLLDGRLRLPLTRDEKGRPHLLSLRGALGLADGFGDDLPFFERFVGGGAIGDFPIRGFEYRGIGPEASGVHLGGHFGYATSLEYEYPLYSSYDPLFDEHIEYLRGVAFLDLASIEDGFGDLFGRTRAAVGAGLRIKLPFLGPVPVALDVGIPLLEESDDDTEVLSVRISTRLF